MTIATTDRLPSGTEITPELRQAWLAERRHGIGASEVAAIVGADPYRTPLDIYMAKLGLAEPEPETFAQWFGLAMEPVLGKAYERETGHAIVQHQVFMRSGYLSATLDGLRDDGRIVELKTVNARNRALIELLGEPGSDEVPPVWQWQQQAQMDVAGHDVADLAVLIGGGDFRVYAIARHPRLVEHMWRVLGEFRQRVENRDPPPPLSTADVRHLATLYRETKGEVELGSDIGGIADEFEASGRQIRLLEASRAQHRMSLLAAMGPAEIGRLPDGREVRRKVVEVKAHEVKASTQVRLTIKGGS